jgi:hypothetical protein
MVEGMRGSLGANINGQFVAFEDHGLGLYSLPELYRNVHTGSINTTGEGERIFSGGIYNFSPNLGVSTNEVGDPTNDGDGPCQRMADRAQAIADKLIRAGGTDLIFGGGKREDEWNIVLANFDSEFTTEYIGQTVPDNLEAYRLWMKIGGTKSGPREQYGQSDFKDKYIDAEWDRYSNDLQADQVHHFAAFLSMGINNTNIAALLHTGQDAYNSNRGDVALSNSAHALGRDLRLQPNLLRDIGQRIRSEYCVQPKVRGGLGRRP